MELRDTKVAVVGMGRSALGAVRLLLHHGALPFVTDCSSADALAVYCRELDELGVPYETGGHTERAFSGAGLVVMSPGVPPDVAPVRAAREAGIEVVGELELGWRFCTSRVLAVTGTNGKTTTTELLRAMIAHCGHTVLLAGNNDLPFSLAVLEEPAPDYFVLEVSSYQLETVSTFRPWIAAVLNLTPDHLGRHGTMEEYAAVKSRIFRQQEFGNAAVVNLDDLWCAGMAVPEDVIRSGFSLMEWSLNGLWVDDYLIRLGDEVVAEVAENPLPGQHNLMNVLGALAMMRAGGFAWDKTREALRAFRGVEHRIEHVACAGGVDYFNDSKSTNVDSLRVALESFGRPVVLIAGGRGKGAGYDSLLPLVRERVKHLVTLGEDAPLLEAAFSSAAPCERASGMRHAAALARDLAVAGDVVLLSPGCASFDMYANFEERGQDFKACVLELIREDSTV